MLFRTRWGRVTLSDEQHTNYDKKRRRHPDIVLHGRDHARGKVGRIVWRGIAKGVYLSDYITSLLMYLHQREDWTNFRWDAEKLMPLLAGVRNLQGLLMGRMASLGFRQQEEATLEVLTLDILKSSAIEGELLNPDQVRSSVARRLGIEMAGLVYPSYYVDGVVEMMLDATQRYTLPLTDERLFGWHAALFPMGYSGSYRIEVAKYRTGVMQIVSGAMGKERVHFEAPEPERVVHEMQRFTDWYNADIPIDPVIKAAVAHVWFETIHPFDDGNGRIGRAIVDMQLTRSDGSPQRFYSMSNQIMAERSAYYKALEDVQHSDGDITPWIEWFLGCLERALKNSEETFRNVLAKARFWEENRDVEFNPRQRLMINKLFTDFKGKLTVSKWAKMAKTTAGTATQDINDLIEKGVLRKETEEERCKNYELIREKR